MLDQMTKVVNTIASRAIKLKLAVQETVTGFFTQKQTPITAIVRTRKKMKYEKNKSPASKSFWPHSLT
jgi:hypothetical protein